MDEATARFLVSGEARPLLESVAVLPGDAAARVLALRKRRDLTPEIAAGAVAVVDARRRAAGRRFPGAADLFFTPDALAQATSPALSAYHAERLAGFGTVADLGCGVGMDAIALAEAGATVTAIDRDPARIVFARANAEARGVADRISFVHGDVTTLEWAAAAAFFDPARREGDRRVSQNPDRYDPPLAFVATIRARTRAAGVKLSPALPDDILADLGGRVVFLSENRECKEACVWLGDGISEPFGAAVLLPEKIVAEPDDSPPVGPLGAFVHDPDPALIRAGALAAVEAERISHEDAYLTSDRPARARLASSYRVLDAMPYKPRVVGEWLKSRGFGRLVVKKRHFAKEPDAVARELHLSGSGPEATLILVREAVSSHLAILCQPFSGAADADL